MKGWKIALFVFCLLLGTYLAIPAFLPSGFETQQSITVQAKPAAVFKQLSDLRNWQNWSAWSFKDTGMTIRYSEPTNEVGANMEWNSEITADGLLEIRAIEPNKSILLTQRLNNRIPSEIQLTLASKGAETKISWSQKAQLPYLWRWGSVFLQQVIEEDATLALNQLKHASEQAQQEPGYKIKNFLVEEFPSTRVLSIIDSCSPAGIGPTLGKLYARIQDAAGMDSFQMAGAPMAYFHAIDSLHVVLEAAIPVSEKKKISLSGVNCKEMPEVKVLIAEFFGPYEEMNNCMKEINVMIARKNLRRTGPEFDIYVTDPATVADPMEMHTRMCFPVSE